MDPDYELLSPLRADERFELSRGRRARTGAPVLIKRRPRHCPAPRRHRGAAARGRTRREPASAATPAAALVVPDAGHPLLVMEDPGGALLSTRVAARRPVARRGAGRRRADGRRAGGAAAARLRAPRPAARGGAVRRRRPARLAGRFRRRRAGAARAVGRQGAAASPARLVYFAPEQTGRHRPRASMRAATSTPSACVLYELLTGAPPFALRRSARADPLAHRRQPRAAGAGATPAIPRAAVGPGDEAAREDARGALPERRRPGAGPAVCARQWVGARARSRRSARPARRRRAAVDRRRGCTAASARCTRCSQAFERRLPGRGRTPRCCSSRAIRASARRR